jgi:hypothetical protein
MGIREEVPFLFWFRIRKEIPSISTTKSAMSYNQSATSNQYKAKNFTK